MAKAYPNLLSPLKIHEAVLKNRIGFPDEYGNQSLENRTRFRRRIGRFACRNSRRVEALSKPANDHSGHDHRDSQQQYCVSGLQWDAAYTVL